MAKSLQEQAKLAIAALEELRQAAFLDAGAATVGEEAFSLEWTAGMEAEELAEIASAKASECVAEKQVFRHGLVYCYACHSSSCEHARVPGADQVFTGYASTGCPEWTEFFRYLLELGDSRTDRLFDDSPQLLARVIGRNRLIADQLVSFGKNSLSYRIWGQVVAGYVSIAGQRTALSVQIVEGKSHRLQVQVLTPEELRAAMVDTPLGGRTALHRIHEALQEIRRDIESISHFWEAHHGRKQLPKTREKVFSALRHLANSIEQKGRQRKQRTAHAEQRNEQSRPVHAAREDLLQASPADFFRDTFRQSMIVRGRGERVHVFNQQGRHVTSLFIKGDEFTRREQRHRYVPLSADDAEILRLQATKLVGGSE